MTTPGHGRGAPPFEAQAQDAIAAARGEQQRQRGYVPEPQPLTEDEKTAAAEIARQALWCRLCACVHPLPNTAACPRLASFELDGDSHVKAGTFWPGLKWARGRATPIEDLHEKEDGDGDH